MKILTLKDPRVMGAYDEDYGYSYWSYVEEQQMPVKFSKHLTNIPAGAKIVAEEFEEKQGQKGPFMQLRKVKVDGGTPVDKSKTQQTTITASTADSQPKKEWQQRDDSHIKAQWAIGQAVQLQARQGLTMPHYDELEVSAKLLYAMVERVKSGKTNQTVELEKLSGDKYTEDTVIMDIGDEPINLDDIPF